MSTPGDDWHAQETYRSMIELGRGMLRFTFLANGAAIISILTFLGDLYAKGGDVPHMKAPLVFFLFGVLLAGAATLTMYVIQFMLYNEIIYNEDSKGWGSHMTWLHLTLGLVTLSMLTFAVGALWAIWQLH